jgi:alpha-beta hydrolase superfamily lysophospholipase
MAPDVPLRQFTIHTVDDRGLHCRRWGPHESQTALVVVHGLGEHSGWYDEFARFMAGQAVSTFAYDQHGHGKSPGVRGHAPSLETFVQDIQTVCRYVTEQQPQSEVVLLGHSMGGHCVLRFLLDSELPRIDRAVVTNPMILPKHPPTEAQSFAAWLTAKVIPRFRVTTEMNRTQLTQDSEMLERLSDDPLLHEKLSIGVGGELMSSGHQLIDRAGELRTSLLFLIGGDDELCDTETSQLFCDQGGDRVIRKAFPGLRHSLLLETERQQVFRAIGRWLRTSLPLTRP